MGLIPQNPVFKPTEKQLVSLLKAADSEYSPTDSSITWRVFIVKHDGRLYARDGDSGLSRDSKSIFRANSANQTSSHQNELGRCLCRAAHCEVISGDPRKCGRSSEDPPWMASGADYIICPAASSDPPRLQPLSVHSVVYVVSTNNPQPILGYHKDLDQ